MIDLTLNSFLHPDLVGLKPPFGTIIERTAENKGGLSTAQTDNNMAMPFALMRPVTVAASDTTSKVEYDAKLLLTGDTPLTIHLDDATYEGCTVTVVNGTTVTAAIIAGKMNGITSHTLMLARGKTVTLLWAGGWISIAETGGEGHFSVLTGEMKMYMGNTAPKGWLVCDGSTYQATTYPELAALLLPLPFNDGVDAEQFRVPDMRGRFPQGADGNLGQSIEAGLPNITGTTNGAIQHQGNGGGGVSGAFTYQATSSGNSSGSSTAGQYTFNASRSSPIYGRSNTVQPPSVALNYIIKY